MEFYQQIQSTILYRWFRCWLLTTGFLAVLPSFATAENQVKVAVDDYAPWKIVEHGVLTGGIDIMLTDYIFDQLGMDTLYEVFPWKRCLHNMERGTSDFISGVLRTPEREAYLHFIQPAYKTKSVKVFYVKKGHGAEFSELAHFRQQLVGYLRGAKYFKEFDNDHFINKQELDSDAQALKLVAADRLDAAILTMENGEFLLSRHPELREQIELAEYSYEKSINVYFAISKKSWLLDHKDAVQQVVQEAVESKHVEKLISGFFAKRP